MRAKVGIVTTGMSAISTIDNIDRLYCIESNPLREN